MKRQVLYIVAALIWGVPGIIITIKGAVNYAETMPNDLWWLLLITACVATAFYFMFNRIVDRYSNRIASLPESNLMIWQTFSLRGWSVLLFMMMLGLTIRVLPSVPEGFTASFYTGLGPMLLFSSMRFATRYCKE